MKLDARGMVRLNEKDVRAQIKSFLAAQGLYVAKIEPKKKRVPAVDRNILWWNLQSMGSYQGLPDMAGLYCKRMFWIETKAPGEKLSPTQEIVVAIFRNQGQQVFVSDSLDGFMKEWREWVNQ